MRGEFVDLDGVRVYCHAAGTRGRGAPVVLLHGAFTSSHLWEEVVPLLPDGHRILLVDLAGHGRSDPPTHAPTVAHHASLVGALLRVLGVEGATVVGHDLGAAIALQLAAAHPARVARVVAVSPSYTGPRTGARGLPPRLRRVARLRPLLQRLPPGWLASALHAALLPGFVHPSQGARTLDQHLLPARTRGGRDAAAAQLAALQASGDTRSAPAAGAPLPCPVAVVVGALDGWGRREGAALGARPPAPGEHTVPTHLIPGVGAMLPHEAPDSLAGQLEALLECADGAGVARVVTPPAPES